MAARPPGVECPRSGSRAGAGRCRFAPSRVARAPFASSTAASSVCSMIADRICAIRQRPHVRHDRRTESVRRSGASAVQRAIFVSVGVLIDDRDVLVDRLRERRGRQPAQHGGDREQRRRADAGAAVRRSRAGSALQRALRVIEWQLRRFPRGDAAGDLADLREAVLLQQAGGNRRAIAAGAVDEQRAIRRQLAGALRRDD